MQDELFTGELLPTRRPRGVRPVPPTPNDQAQAVALQEQFPLLRALWPGPLLVRWNLNRLYGPYGHEGADKRYGEFDILMDPDRDTRQALAGVIRGTTGAGEAAFGTISNKAEGSTPLSVRALAGAIVAA